MGSDLTTAIALAKAALEGALANVEINLESIKLESIKLDVSEDEAFLSQTRKSVAALKAQV
jgi:formiminotetrahydrofolate cyclodeaminase